MYVVRRPEDSFRMEDQCSTDVGRLVVQPSVGRGSGNGDGAGHGHRNEKETGPTGNYVNVHDLHLPLTKGFRALK